MNVYLELDPCKRCGEEIHLVVERVPYGIKDLCAIRCRSCGFAGAANTECNPFYANAQCAWNTRAAPQQSIPFAWFRVVQCGGSPAEPNECDFDIQYGEDQPTHGSGWSPLYLGYSPNQSPPAAPSLSDEAQRLRDLINTPELHDFAKGVVLEAVHQREKWGTENDAGKKAPDWFWLIGYLAQKAMTHQLDGNTDKALHHTITTAAALANWHAAISGNSISMRPGKEVVL